MGAKSPAQIDLIAVPNDWVGGWRELFASDVVSRGSSSLRLLPYPSFFISLAVEAESSFQTAGKLVSLRTRGAPRMEYVLRGGSGGEGQPVQRPTRGRVDLEELVLLPGTGQRGRVGWAGGYAGVSNLPMPGVWRSRLNGIHDAPCYVLTSLLLVPQFLGAGGSADHESSMIPDSHPRHQVKGVHYSSCVSARVRS